MPEQPKLASDDLSQQIAQLSQEVKQASTEVLTATTASDTAYAENPWWSVKNAMTISVAVLAFGLMVIFTIAYLIQRGRDPEQLLKIFGTTLILVMAVFLVVAGYSDQQISPVMGLMGTIAGYLLGRNAQGNEPPKKD